MDDWYVIERFSDRRDDYEYWAGFNWTTNLEHAKRFPTSLEARMCAVMRFDKLVQWWIVTYRAARDCPNVPEF